VCRVSRSSRGSGGGRGGGGGGGGRKVGGSAGVVGREGTVYRGGGCRVVNTFKKKKMRVKWEERKLHKKGH